MVCFNGQCVCVESSLTMAVSTGETGPEGAGTVLLSLLHLTTVHTLRLEAGREGGRQREGGREAGREGGSQGGRKESWRQGGRVGRREEGSSTTGL